MSNLVLERVFSRLPIRIGRNALNDLQLDHKFVSQFHAVLEMQDGRLMLRDLGSTNGTLLKGGRVPPNESVALADHGFDFAILSLLFRTFSAVEDVPAASRPQRPLAATSMFNAARAGQDLSDLAQVRAIAPRLATLSTRATAIKSQVDELVAMTDKALGELPAPTHQEFVRQVIGLLPSLEREPRFRALLADRGVVLNLDPNLSPQEMALRAMQEMAVHYMPSVGAPSSREDLARFITKLNETVNVFLKCFVPLKEGHRKFEADLALRSPGRGATDPQLAVENARDAQELALRLLDWRDASFEASRTVESVFADIMIHQVAMLNGVMMGVKSLLDELSPAAVELAASDPRHKAGLLQGHHKALWKVYEQRHADLADDQKRLFSVLFGREFGQAYRGMGGESRTPPPAGTPQTLPPNATHPGPPDRFKGPGFR